MGSPSHAHTGTVRFTSMNLQRTPDRGRTSLYERSDRPGLIFKPRVDQVGPRSFRIMGLRDDERTVPWGFWGGLLAVAVGVGILGYGGVTGLWALWDMVGAIAVLTVGILLMRYGARTSLAEEPCAEIDLSEGTIRLMSSTAGVALPEIRIADVTEVVFGMTRYPVSKGEGAVNVEAYTLLVRHASDTLVPVVEVSPDKDQLFGVAKFIARVTGQRMTQVGIGVK